MALGFVNPIIADPFTIREKISDAQINGSKRAQRGFRDEYGPAAGERD
jgi:hypothetical protein